MKNFFKNSDLKKRTSLPRDFPGRLTGARRAHMSQKYFSTKEQYLDSLTAKGKHQKIFIFFVRIFYAFRAFWALWACAGARGRPWTRFLMKSYSYRHDMSRKCLGWIWSKIENRRAWDTNLLPCLVRKTESLSHREIFSIFLAFALLVVNFSSDELRSNEQTNVNNDLDEDEKGFSNNESAMTNPPIWHTGHLMPSVKFLLFHDVLTVGNRWEPLGTVGNCVGNCCITVCNIL